MIKKSIIYLKKASDLCEGKKDFYFFKLSILYQSLKQNKESLDSIESALDLNDLTKEYYF
jgi:hypothetical protein